MWRILIIVIVITMSGIETHADGLMGGGKKYYSEGDFRKAASLFESFVRSHPGSAEGYLWLGKAYFSLGNNEFATEPEMLEKAAKAFGKALSAEPGNPEAHFNLGMTYVSLDDGKQAMKEYQALKGSNKELADRLLANIRNHSFPPVYRMVRENEYESKATHVTIVGNQVLVPVILGRDGNEVRANLLLDTGANVTSIHSYVAAGLRIDPAQTQKIKGQVVGGGLLDVWRTRVSYITVGPHTRTGVDVAIVEHKGPPVPYDGLLGMNFLRGIRYTIDFENRTINWLP